MERRHWKRSYHGLSAPARPSSFEVRRVNALKKGAPFKVGLRRRLRTDGKEHPNEQHKVYWHGRPSGKHLDSGQ
jgi:hypothetical protein